MSTHVAHPYVAAYPYYSAPVAHHVAVQQALHLRKRRNVALVAASPFTYSALSPVTHSVVAPVAAHHVAVASPIVPAVAASSQYHAQDELGQYSYGYSGGPSAKYETKTADGVTQGGYSYVDSHGLVQSVAYTADAHNGFRVAATNLPVH